MWSFLILSFLVTPRENLNFLISSISSSLSCLFVIAAGGDGTFNIVKYSRGTFNIVKS